MKKLLVILIAIAMMTSLFAGCRQATTAPAAGSAETNDGPSWTWDTSPITIDWYVHEGWYDKPWDVVNNVTDAYITEMTGVTVNFLTGGDDARLNAMIASNNLPDVVTIGWYFDQWPLLQESRQLRPLLPLIERSAPTFKLPDSMVGWYTFDDGNFYGIPSFFWAAEDITEKHSLETNDGIIAREDIMKQLGIRREDFNTVEGALNAFRKVRDAQLVYNGLRVVPVNLGPGAGMGQGGWPGDTIRILANHFGIPDEDSKGNLIERPFDERFLEVLRFMNTLHRENLISRDNFTMDRAQVEEAWASGAIFSAIYQLSDLMGPSRTLKQNDSDINIIAVGPIRQYRDQPVYLGSRATSGWTVTGISQKAKNADRIIRFFEFMYGQEGQLANEYGVEGVTWKWDNGKVVTIDIPDDQESGHGMLWWFYNPPFHQLVQSEPTSPEFKMTYDYYNYFNDWAYDSMALSDLEPRGGTDEHWINEEIKQYWYEQLPRMVMASSEAEMEAIWRNAVKTVYEMGYEAVYEVKNARFQMLKERLGQEFAWPGNIKN